ncbi:hypothetical protein ACHHYP_01525 [Achlya hypogyna]|uniref:Transmembrane protein n=1 Tax=Achlya hypogyna TaxID=1202772 RepID=A0A1V9Z8B8_ACHHY|nr:hypothetical protein ACHHYP_01525 [Achlya hypogyna]
MVRYVDSGSAANLAGAGGLLLWFGYAAHEESSKFHRPASKIWSQLALGVTAGLGVASVISIYHTDELAPGGVVAGSAVAMSTIYTMQLLDGDEHSSPSTPSQWS